jgi:hypothetical protein
VGLHNVKFAATNFCRLKFLLDITFKGKTAMDCQLQSTLRSMFCHYKNAYRCVSNRCVSVKTSTHIFLHDDLHDLIQKYI